MLLRLVVTVLVAIGCVVWFMREAMRNERLAVREELAEAYRGQLTWVQTQMGERWEQWLSKLDDLEPDPSSFARAVREGLADSVIITNVYPNSQAARSLDASAELLASASSTNIAIHLGERVNDYSTNALPSAQRRFIMHELQRLNPELRFPTLAAEELAARYLETKPSDVWPVASPNRRVVALFTTAGLRGKLSKDIRTLPRGVTVAVVAPGEEAVTESTLATVVLDEIPGWRLSLSDNRNLFDKEADRRVSSYLAVGIVVIAAMASLAVFMARSFGRQVALARLKNDLVANVSHELKTPLTAMRAVVDTLLDAKKFDEKTTREYLQLLATENARLSRLIENFLTFSRLERNKFKFEFEDIRPLDVVVGAVEALGERVNAPGCRFESHAATDLPSIRGDTDALVTALLNLLDNAWKYSGEDKHIVLRTEARNGNVCFTVVDNGIGLSPRETKRVFRRFYQTDQRLARVAGGCGLGLSIVQSIVEAHHGFVRVQSEPGGGSTFTIEIPALVRNPS
jgi:signal transduction histidine kinase